MYGLIKSNQVTIGKVEIRETNSKPEGRADQTVVGRGRV